MGRYRRKRYRRRRGRNRGNATKTLLRILIRRYPWMETPLRVLLIIAGIFMVLMFIGLLGYILIPVSFMYSN